MKIIFQPKPKERGQSMIELALVITILLVLLAGTVDLGRAFFTWLALRDAAQEGAAYGSAMPEATTAMIEARIRQTFSDVVTASDAIIIVGINFPNDRCLGYHADPADPANPNAYKPNTIIVNVDYQNFPITMPFLGTILGSQTIPIHATINDTVISPVCP
jgi:Flp pilus assembly protein TadG